MNTIATAPATPHKKLRVFKSHIRSTQFIFGNQPNFNPMQPQRSPINGKTAAFIDGKYRTDNALEIEQLEHEVAAGHSTIYIDPNESEVEISTDDPLAALKQKWLAEERETIRAEVLRSINPHNDAGSYEATRIKPQGTDQLDTMGLTEADRLTKLNAAAAALKAGGTTVTPNTPVTNPALTGVNLGNLKASTPTTKDNN